MKLRKFDLEHEYRNFWWLRSARSQWINQWVGSVYDDGDITVTYYLSDNDIGLITFCFII